MSYNSRDCGGFTIVENEGGATLGTASGKIIERDGLAFKDLAGTGELLPFEDWRLPAKERAQDLASRLSIEEIAGLMMYSPHQMVPFPTADGPFAGSYGGKSFAESGMDPWALSDQQRAFLEGDHVRHVLLMAMKDKDTAARWNNELQRFVEQLPFGIPVNLSSDPRHGAAKAGAEFKVQADDVSKWPEGLGLAATFSPEICRRYGEVVSQEYRALGIATALSPQVDISTEPRWMRIEDTFGPHPKMTADFSKAYCDGMQTTDGAADGWGAQSVATMAKHWPGGATGESGRDGHYPFGQYAVYPGDNFEMHQRSFLEGVFDLDGPTGATASVMPYYTVSWGIDQKYGRNVGNSYSRYIIKDLLREKYGFDGIICTDWGITGEPLTDIDSFGPRCYGVGDLSEAEQHLLVIENGVDQFGGNSNMAPIIEAYRIGCERHGEEAMRKRFEESATRLLMNMFRCGLFENPYLDIDQSDAIVGCEDNCKAGYAAQLASLVLIKNGPSAGERGEKPAEARGPLPVLKGASVYVPKRHIDARKNFLRMMDPEQDIDPVSDEILSGYYRRVDEPSQADFALVFVESPSTDGFSSDDLAAGGNGYMPISLQYRPYTATAARKESIAGGDPRDTSANRSYLGKTSYAANESDLDAVIEAKKVLGDKPVVVVLRMHNPCILAELEPYADAIVVDFGVQQQAILDTVSGASEPSGLLPVVLPANMDDIEHHCEDVPFDYPAYVDAAGHAYGFGFGMNWSGIISDGRTRRYTADWQKGVEIFDRRSFLDVESHIDYDFYGGRPDFSEAQIGDRWSLVLANKSTGALERLSFKITRNELFPLVGERWVYGLVESDDYNVQLEIKLRKEPSPLDSAIAFLAAPEVF